MQQTLTECGMDSADHVPLEPLISNKEKSALQYVTMELSGITTRKDVFALPTSSTSVAFALNVPTTNFSTRPSGDANQSATLDSFTILESINADLNVVLFKLTHTIWATVFAHWDTN